MTAKTTQQLRIIDRNLNLAIKQLGEDSIGGLLAGGLIFQAEAQRRVPVQFGNLRGSAYTRKAQAKGLKAVEVGFTASYAAAVHENLEQKWKGMPRKAKKGKVGVGVYWGPSGEPKFLENAVTAKRDEAVATVAKYSKVKPR